MAVVVTRTAVQIVFLTFIVSGCQVALDKSTPGSAACAPTDDQVNTFYADVDSTVIQAGVGGQSCVSCHSQTGIAPSPVFIASPANIDEKKTNMCRAFRYGPRHPSQRLATFPLTTVHGDRGGVKYSLSQIEALYAWVFTFTL